MAPTVSVMQYRRPWRRTRFVFDTPPATGFYGLAKASLEEKGFQSHQVLGGLEVWLEEGNGYERKPTQQECVQIMDTLEYELGRIEKSWSGPWNAGMRFAG